MTAAAISLEPPPVPMSAQPVVSARRPPPVTAAAAAAAIAAPSRPTATATAKRKADCNPNFTLDAHGNKIFKPECF
jgi:hypothetical protein